MRPGLIEAIAATPGVVPYFDLSFQHASAAGAAPDAPVRRHRRASSTCSSGPRAAPRRPASAATSSSASPARPRTTSPSSSGFLAAARLDAIGVFGYSDEDGTEAADAATASSTDDVIERARRAGDARWPRSCRPSAPRSGSADGRGAGRGGRGGRRSEGRAAHQAPEVDGDRPCSSAARRGLASGDLVPAVVVGSEGVDLVADRSRRSATRASRGASGAIEPSERDPIGRAARAGAVSVWNVANALTVLRLVLVPVFVWLLLSHRSDQPGWRLGPPWSFAVAIAHRPRRRPARPQARPGHRLRQDRRPDRRQGADRHGVDRAVRSSASCRGG